MLRITLFLFLIFTFSCDLFAGAWVRAPQEVYSKLSVSRFESDEVFSAKGSNKLPGPDFVDNAVSLYAEYGFHPKWTGIVFTSFKSLSSETAGVEQTNSGLVDTWFFLKRSLYQKQTALSVQAGIKLPAGYSRTTVPPLGDGQIDLEARVLVGRSFYPFPGYGNAEVGFRKRNGDLSDEFPYLLELGVNVGKRVLLQLVYEGVDNTSNDTASKAANRNPNVFDEEFTKIAPAVIVSLTKGWAFDITYSTLLTGGNTAAGDTLSVGLSYQGKIFTSKPR